MRICYHEGMGGEECYCPQEDGMEAFFYQRQEWSFETFGAPTERGALGPLAHLLKEVNEATLVATENAEEDRTRGYHSLEMRANLLEELADCNFLVQDAVSRAGFTYEEFLAACWAKLAKNRARKWGARSADGVVEHIRD